MIYTRNAASARRRPEHRGGPPSPVQLPVTVTFPPSEAVAGTPTTAALAAQHEGVPTVGVSGEGGCGGGGQPATAPDPETTWPLQHLLDAVVSSGLDRYGSYERATVGYLLTRSGHTGAWVRCRRCAGEVMPVERFVFVHFAATERAHRLRRRPDAGPTTALHRWGDVEPLGASDP